MELSGEIGQPLSLTVQDDRGNRVSLTGELPVEAAHNETSPESNFEKLQTIAQKELGALSATAYKLDSLSIKIPQNAFIASKVLRLLRQKSEPYKRYQ